MTIYYVNSSTLLLQKDHITTTENKKYLNKKVHCLKCLPLLSTILIVDDSILASRIDLTFINLIQKI